jgi:hypothetical protein
MEGDGARAGIDEVITLGNVRDGDEKGALVWGGFPFGGSLKGIDGLLEVGHIDRRNGVVVKDLPPDAFKNLLEAAGAVDEQAGEHKQQERHKREDELIVVAFDPVHRG